jgi:hypothetical protein
MRCVCYLPANKETGTPARGQLRYGFYKIEGTVYVYSRKAADLIRETKSKLFTFTELGKAKTAFGRNAWAFRFKYQTNDGHREGNWNSDLQDDFRTLLGTYLYDIAEMKEPEFTALPCTKVTSGDATGD